MIDINKVLSEKIELILGKNDEILNQIKVNQ